MGPQQAEGGINVASVEWLKEVYQICKDNDIIMIVDDIQVGNGRTGTFFTFERAGIKPDMVVLSKSISGFGMPMAILLIRPDLDIFRPAEHNGTFRGKPAAIILETVQAEGGINVASVEWLKEVYQICKDNDIIMIVDDIQVGNGRTGTFFTFERAGIKPDMVVLSKSISGFGMPMAILLIRPDLDIFRPAEHNGTFRGNQLSFVGATAGINYYVEHSMDKEVQRKAKIISDFLESEIIPLNKNLSYRGIGFIWGIDFNAIDSTLALKVVHKAFDNGLIMEVAGRKDGVLKIMPPLTIQDDILNEGLNVMKESIVDVLN